MFDFTFSILFSFLMDLPMVELIKLAKQVSCMRQIMLTLSGAPGDCID